MMESGPDESVFHLSFPHPQLQHLFDYFFCAIEKNEQMRKKTK